MLDFLACVGLELDLGLKLNKKDMGLEPQKVIIIKRQNMKIEIIGKNDTITILINNNYETIIKYKT